MDGWESNDWMSWEFAQALHQNGIWKYCSTACAGFLLMPHDEIGGRGYPTACCRSGSHPWWMYFCCQPINVEISKALKVLVQKDREDWMLDLGINLSMVKFPTWQLIVEWGIKACDRFQRMLCKILGGMESILGFIELIKCLCVLHYVIR